MLPNTNLSLENDLVISPQAKHFQLPQQQEGAPAVVTDDESISTVKDVSKPRSRNSKRKELAGQKTLLQGFAIRQDVKDGVHTADLASDLNHERRKRQKTASPKAEQEIDHDQHHEHATGELHAKKGYDALGWRGQLELEAQAVNDNSEIELGHELQSVGIRDPSKDDDRENVHASRSNHDPKETTIRSKESSTSSQSIQLESAVTSPLRSMRLKGGRLASPRVQRQEKSTPMGHKSNGSDKKVSRQLTVKISYAHHVEWPTLGLRIQNILNGQERFSISPSPVSQSKLAPKMKSPGKSTHPFFTSKVPKLPAEAQDKQPSETVTRKKKYISVASPRKAAALSNSFRIRQPELTSSGLEMANRGTVARSKIAGGAHPAWPTRDNLHVRGFDLTIRQLGNSLPAGFVSRSSKRKVMDLDSASHTSLASCIGSYISTEDAALLRTPGRAITTGIDIQSQIVTSVSAPAADTKLDSHALARGLHSDHPALHAMFSPIAQELTPFDRFECETRTWSHKYAPRCASEVLQTGREANILRDLLSRSMVNAVQTSSNRSNASSAISSKTMREKPVKKKRKRKDDLDGFLAMSDDDSDEPDLEPLDDTSRPRTLKPSLVRGGNNFAQTPVLPGCAMLLSGPHGCGKTATVYAVAQELGFEVFELNPSLRRSGKDVLEKVGDMTGNHQVQRQITKALAEDKIPDPPLPEVTGIDQTQSVASTQKSMASFLKFTAATKVPSVSRKPKISEIQPNKETTAVKRVQQKQSLILLEEVDVLYEEDKQFWLTVLTMVLYSKRPIVMTCTDERFIPESLNFQAILRLVSPPVQLATDYLLLIAAREGHICSRDSIESLYLTKGLDLRASINELNFWCQMGVGDPTRGFNWTIERYPPGVDMDAQGRTLRVTSRNTYLKGMSVIAREVDVRETNPSASQLEDLWLHASEQWNIACPIQHPRQGDGNVLTQADRLQELDLWTLNSDVASVGDICCGNSIRQPHKQRFDHSLPPLNEKARTNYCLSLSGTQNVLQAEPYPQFDLLDKRLQIGAHLAATSLFFQENPSFDQRRSAAEHIIGIVEHTRDPNKLKSELSRTDFATALDAFAYDPDDVPSQTTSTFPASSFDREFGIIPTELAPYIRLIAYEYKCREQERIRMSSILSVGGQGKRRQTRAARTAIEGGRRQEQRRARYFDKLSEMGINWAAITITAGQDWMNWSTQSFESTADETHSVGSVDTADGEKT